MVDQDVLHLSIFLVEDHLHQRIELYLSGHVYVRHWEEQIYVGLQRLEHVHNDALGLLVWKLTDDEVEILHG